MASTSATIHVLTRGGVHLDFDGQESRDELVHVLGTSRFNQDRFAGMLNARAGDRIYINAAYAPNAVFAMSQRDGVRAGFTLVRTPSGLTVQDTFVIAESGTRGTAANGFAILDSIKAMIDMGVTRVEGTANGNPQGGPGEYDGYYAWARLGFSGSIPSSVRDSAQARFPGVTTVQALMGQPGGAAWWKQHGVSWQATIDLTPGSPGRAAIDRYFSMRQRHANTRP